MNTFIGADGIILIFLIISQVIYACIIFPVEAQVVYTYFPQCFQYKVEHTVGR